MDTEVWIFESLNVLLASFWWVGGSAPLCSRAWLLCGYCLGCAGEWADRIGEKYEC